MRQISERFIHPKFEMEETDLSGDTESAYYDIAVLRLSSPINFTHKVQPICLPPTSSFSYDDVDKHASHSAWVTGWGGTVSSGGAPSDKLLETQVTVKSQRLVSISVFIRVSLSMIII